MNMENSELVQNELRRSSNLLRFWQNTEAEKQLLVHDIDSTFAHLMMLGEIGIIDQASVQSLLINLKQIKNELEQGKSYLKDEHPDIHVALEERLRELVGDLAEITRTAKSVNDQIATDIRLWLREAVIDIFIKLLELRECLLILAKRDLEIVVPGYTHMQPAMPILLSHWWLANEARLRRDFSRLLDFYRRFNVLPLGAGALAGTSQPIDRRLVAKYLNFDDVIENSLYAVSDRDYIVEFGSFATLVGLHVSEIATDLLLWSTQEFNFVKLSKAFLFGSHSMPQKRNPIALEVLRARPCVIFGRLMEFIATLKATPMGYCADLQDCLPGLLDVVDNLKYVLKLLQMLLPALVVNAERMKQVALADLTNASAAVDYLVVNGISQQQAANIVRQLVNYCQQRNKYLADLELNEWQQFSPAFDEQIYKHVTVEETVSSRSSFGGTSLEQVSLALSHAQEMLSQDRQNLPKLAANQFKKQKTQGI